MANMSYCRFENTVNDFEDCLDALYEDGVSSEREKRYAEQLHELASEYISAYEEWSNRQEEDTEEEDEEE